MAGLTARPRARVGLATCGRLPRLAEDGAETLAALFAVGIDATAVVWDDPNVDWSTFDLVVVRSTWDYVDRREAFLRWANGVPRLANPADVIEWNTDKRYLADLALAGVATVPSSLVGPGETPSLPAGEIVVKPAIGSGARGAGRYGPDDRAAAAAHVAALTDAGEWAIVQPYLSGVEDEGERCLVFLGDRFSHAVRKPPLLAKRGRFVEAHHPPRLAETVVASAADRAFAEEVLGAVPSGRRGLLYARVDLLSDDGATLLNELELAEPHLYLTHEEGAAARFAAAVSAAVTGS